MIRAALLGLCTAALVVAVAIAGGCLTPPPAGQQIADAQNAAACVRSHWGDPVPVVAGACFNGIAQAAEDGLADVEAVVEGSSALAQQDVGKVQAACPYASSSAIMAKAAGKRDALLAKLRDGA